MRTFLVSFMLAVVLLVPLVTVAAPGTVKTLLPYATAGQTVVVAADEVIDRNYYVAGNTVTIDGTVEGDVIAAGGTLIINGTVGGDVIAAARSVRITGAVGGNVRAVAGTVEIVGTIARNANLAGDTITIEPDALVGWSLLVAGRTFTHRGTVGGHIDGWTGSADLRGETGGDVALRVGTDGGTLQVGRKAMIGGNLTYWGETEATINDDATITGDLTYHRLDPASASTRVLFDWHTLWLILKFATTIGSLILGLVLVIAFPGMLKRTTDAMLTKPLSRIGWGFLLMIVVPIALVLILATVIGIPVAAFGLSLVGLAMMVSGAIAGMGLGLLILNRREGATRKQDLVWATLIGVILFGALTAIPFLGWFVSIIGYAWAFGSLIIAKLQITSEENDGAFPAPKRAK